MLKTLSLVSLPSLSAEPFSANLKMDDFLLRIHNTLLILMVTNEAIFTMQLAI